MKFIAPPTAGAPGATRSGDDLDGLLRAFFQAETPHPWPELEPPATTSVASTRLAFWRQIKRSHLALAASVALLIAGSLLFRGELPLLGRIFRGEEVGTNQKFDNDDPSKAPKPTPVDPSKISIKESIIVGPEGAGVLIESDDNRY
jgi:hypothetical protein